MPDPASGRSNRAARARLLAAGGVLLTLGHAPALSAQREIFGINGSSAAEVRRQFEAEARQQVSALLVDYESAWGSRNAGALAGLYASRATFYPAEGAMRTGRSAIADYFRARLPTVETLRTQMVEFRASGDLAYTTVQVSYAAGEGAVRHAVAGIDVFVLRRDVLGGWSIVSHLSRVEPAAATAAGDRAPSAAPADTAHE
ncbi:MAG: YybH family protein [Longimicrobiaceae bacterium]